MTDHYEMAENIQRAMRALDEAQAASKRLREEPNHKTLDAFRAQMTSLCDELQTLKYIFEHESTYAADGLADILSEFFSGEPSHFRRMERFEPETKTKKP